jgi:uncharacterized surface protein with fasciclin (FAS1) repeats
MTYVGPFTQATLMYEQDELPTKGKVATLGTILDYIAKKLPYFLPIIKKANLLSFYNTPGRYTVFLPKSLPRNFPMLDANTAYRLMKMSTMRGIITVNMLSNNQILFPLAHPQNNLSVTKYKDGEIRINDYTLTEGDILCKNGVIHLLDGILWPTY